MRCRGILSTIFSLPSSISLTLENRIKWSSKKPDIIQQGSTVRNWSLANRRNKTTTRWCLAVMRYAVLCCVMLCWDAMRCDVSRDRSSLPIHGRWGVTNEGIDSSVSIESLSCGRRPCRGCGRKQEFGMQHLDSESWEELKGVSRLRNKLYCTLCSPS